MIRIVWGHGLSAHTTEKMAHWQLKLLYEILIERMAHWNFNFISQNGKWPIPWFAYPYHCSYACQIDISNTCWHAPQAYWKWLILTYVLVTWVILHCMMLPLYYDRWNTKAELTKFMPVIHLSMFQKPYLSMLQKQILKTNAYLFWGRGGKGEGTQFWPKARGASILDNYRYFQDTSTIKISY